MQNYQAKKNSKYQKNLTISINVICLLIARIIHPIINNYGEEEYDELLQTITVGCNALQA